MFSVNCVANAAESEAHIFVSQSGEVLPNHHLEEGYCDGAQKHEQDFVYQGQLGRLL